MHVSKFWRETWWQFVFRAGEKSEVTCCSLYIDRKKVDPCAQTTEVAFTIATLCNPATTLQKYDTEWGSGEEPISLSSVKQHHHKLTGKGSVICTCSY